ncbi:MAG: hypothetical protein II777_08340 [Clostridia bacterium]|nr:hypothetical protein [Clostridia bacterium]
MRLSDVYETAAALISEAPDGSDNADLKRRAPFLLSGIITELKPLDDAENGEAKFGDYRFEDLDADFPLCDALAPVCAYKLAYLLAADENTPLYQVLKSEYESAKRAFIRSLPAAVHRIKNVY